MVKRIHWLTVLCCFIAFSVLSEGFVGPSSNYQAVKVRDIENLSDDDKISLIGFIKSAVSDDKYVFSDDTGTIVVEIDKKVWQGVTASPKTKIQIFGEVDKSLMKDTKVEADRVVLVK